MSLTFRRMTIQDVPAAHELDVLSFTLPWPERSLRFEVSDNPASRPWVAELDDQLVAMLILWLIVDEVHVATLATHPDFRRRGIAKKILAQALCSACEEGAKTVLLEVRAGNAAALAMYAKFGFEIVGRRERYYKDNYEDAVLMTLSRLSLDALSRFREDGGLG